MKKKLGAVERIQSLAGSQSVRITAHARSEMDKDGISTNELLAAMAEAECELIEDYPEDKRGHSHLILGRLAPSRPVHICCSIHDEEVVIITVYRPDPTKWTGDWKTRI